MAKRLWSREKMLKWARVLRVAVPEGISDKRLYDMLMQAPATIRQLMEIGDVLAPLGREVPPDMTFGRALQALHLINDQLNTQIIESMGFDDGQVWRWAVKSDATVKVITLMILRVFGDYNDHKMRVQRVTLERPAGAQRATIMADGDPFTVHPKSMYLVATRVNLDTWQPDDEGSVDASWDVSRMANVDELDEPPF